MFSAPVTAARKRSMSADLSPRPGEVGIHTVSRPGHLDVKVRSLRVCQSFLQPPGLPRKHELVAGSGMKNL